MARQHCYKEDVFGLLTRKYKEGLGLKTGPLKALSDAPESNPLFACKNSAKKYDCDWNLRADEPARMRVHSSRQLEAPVSPAGGGLVGVAASLRLN